MNKEERLERLKAVFSRYKGEWFRDEIYNYFSEPYYFSDLKDIRPCVLQGGRGTGKTMVLRSLSYQGQFNLLGKDIAKFDKNDFVGFYIRMNTNHVRAFEGEEIPESLWMRVFGHFINLLFVNEVVSFICWHKELVPDDEELSPEYCSLISETLFLPQKASSQKELFSAVKFGLYKFQSELNCIFDTKGQGMKLSTYSFPIQLVTDTVVKLRQYRGKIMMFLLDEFENLSSYQQVLMNSMLKHITDNYTFKIGVRELGWRVKNTLNPEEILNDPADYFVLDIDKKFKDVTVFEAFAKKVCEKRIREVFNDEDISAWDIEKYLESVSIEDEEDLLGVDSTPYMRHYDHVPIKLLSRIQDLPKLRKFMISYWADTHNHTLEDEIMDYLNDKPKWDRRYVNYGYSLLFKIKRGRGMGGIQKYYAGWDTFIKLANGNIRYLMDLIYRSYERHIIRGHGVHEKVSLELQTKAAEDIGLKNLEELEGLSVIGAQVIKMLLNLGQLFRTMARLDNTAPETNQFVLIGERGEDCEKLLTSAVMNLAIIRIPGNKPNDEVTTKEYQYAIHPIFAPFFNYSYRRKRKMNITVDELMDMTVQNKDTIRKLLKRKAVDADEPEFTGQLNLFSDIDYD